MTARATLDDEATIRQVRAASRMTLLGATISLFPAAVVVGALACIAWFAARPGVVPAAALVAVLYLLPVAVYRLHALVFPLLEGGSRLVGTGYSPWYGSHQIQVVYIAFPVLEGALRLFPGLYSAWLRLWGSRIGRGVYWTPQVDLVDRGLLEIGDRVVMGHRSGIISHVIRPTKGNLFLYVRRVRVGDGALVGAGSYLSAGVVVEPGALVPAVTNIYPLGRVKA
jgi:hypothetical protein